MLPRLLTQLVVPSLVINPRTRASALVRSPLSAGFRLGDQVWIRGPDEYLDALCTTLERQQLATRKNTLARRYGRAVSVVPTSGIDSLLDSYPELRTSISSSPASATAPPEELWVGFRSSLGGFVVGVGIRLDEVSDSCSSAAFTEGAEFDIISDKNEIPVW